MIKVTACPYVTFELKLGITVMNHVDMEQGLLSL